MSRPFRIVLVCYRDDARGGGTVRVAQTLSNALVGAGHIVTLAFAYGGPGPISAGSQAKTVYFDATNARDVRAWSRVWKWFRQSNSDVVHFVDIVNWMTILAALAGKRTIQHIHGRPITSAWKWRDKFVTKLRKLWISKTICISHAARNVMIRERLSPAHSTHVLYNAIDVKSWSKALEHKSFPQWPLTGSKHKYIGQVARMVEANGGEEALKVLKFLPEEWHLIYAGDGPILPRLKELTSQMNLTERVHFLGSVDDPRYVYQRLDAVLMLAQYQPFCLMIAEAMASRVPVFGLYGEGEYTETQRPLLQPTPFFLNRQRSVWEKDSEPDETYRRLAELILRLSGTPAERLRTEQDYHHVCQYFDGRVQACEYLDWLGKWIK